MKATHSNTQKSVRLPSHYLIFCLSSESPMSKEVIKVFQNYAKFLFFEKFPVRIRKKGRRKRFLQIRTGAGTTVPESVKKH